MAREDFRKRRRRGRRVEEPQTISPAETEALDEIEEAPEELEASTIEEFDDSTLTEEVATSGGGSLNLAAWGLVTLGVALAALPFVGLPEGSAVDRFVQAAGLNPTILILGGVLLGAIAGLRGRMTAVEGRADNELARLTEVSSRTQTVLEGVEGFQERLEAIRSDRVVATLNQIRYEVSSLHEKVHRELFPSNDMQPVLAELSSGMGRVLEVLDQQGDSSSETEAIAAVQSQLGDLGHRFDALSTRLEETTSKEGAGVDSSEIQSFCASMQEAVHKLDPSFAQLQSAVETRSESADRGLQHLADLVTRLETEIRDLDRKADQLLATREPGEAPAGGSADSTPPVAEAATVAAAAAAAPEEAEDAPKGANFQSAIERLKHMRGE